MISIPLSWLIIFAIFGAVCFGKYLVQGLIGLWIVLRWGK
jgi:hypothetical protein